LVILVKPFLVLLCMSIKITILFLLLFQVNCYAQQKPDLHFSHLTTKDGLSSNLTKSIFQDQRGIVWICSADAGIDRYDGNSIKNFKYLISDTTSLPSNDVRYITEDVQHKFWIATGAGLYFFDPITEKGKRIILNKENNPMNTLAIKCDSKGFVFVNTDENIYEINSKTGTIVKYVYEFEDNNPLLTQKKKYRDLPHFFEDSNKQLWIGSFFVNQEKKTIQQKGFSNSIFENQLLEDKNKKVWSISWTEGLKEWDESLKTFIVRYNTKDKIHSFSKWEYKDEEYIFMTVYPFGAVLFNINTKTYVEYRHTSDDLSITASEDGSILRDKDNRLWITSSKGVNKLDPAMQRFNYRLLYQTIDKNTDERFGMARAFLETNDEYVVSGSYLKGLFTFTKDWTLKNNLPSIPPNSKTAEAQEITFIHQEINGDTWYSTDNGLVKKSKGVYKPILPDNIKNVAINNDFYFRTILKRPDGKFWIRALGKKLYLFDPITEKFIKDYAKEITAGTNAIALDKESNVWIATINGLFWLDVKKDTVVQILFSTTNKLYEKAINNLRFVYFDKENTLWITTEYGLIKFNTTTKAYQHISQKEGLPEENLLKIVEDNNGFLWINTTKGVIRYDKKQSFNYYTADNGLLFSYNDLRCTFAKSNAGNILFGYNGGIVEFNPADFNTITKNVEATILDVFVDNKFYPLTIEKNKSITVQPNDGQIKIHFGLLNYTSTASNKFYFYLEGIQTEWQENADGNITFYKLPPGTYTLHVKGSIANSTGKNIEDTLIIIVKPRWYQTNLFKAILALLLILIVTSIIVFRSKQIRKKEKLKNFYENKMLHLEMQSLRSQMNPHFMFNTLNSINSYIIQNKTALASDYLTTFSKLMRSILDLSKQETVTLEKELNALKMYIELEALRLENKFDYSIIVDKNIDEQTLQIPSLMLQPFVENAIWHGLHNKKDQGTISIKINEISISKILVTIEDDGIGRAAAAALKKAQISHKSYGIDITKNRLQLLNKNNTVIFTDLFDNNNKASGTKVTITINTTYND
jgi:ligand-binding sensor domain-containing protein/two-component sensor histidine kinase